MVSLRNIYNSLKESQKPFGFPSICDTIKDREEHLEREAVSKAFRLSVDLRPIWNESTKAFLLNKSQKPFGFPSICDRGCGCVHHAVPVEVSKAFRLSVDLRQPGYFQRVCYRR